MTGRPEDSDASPSNELTDEELVAGMKAFWSEFAVPASSVATAEQLFTWRTIDAELESLAISFDSLVDAAPTMRSATSARRIVFESPLRGLEMEVGDHTISGQLLPAQEGDITLMSTKGEIATVRADALGLFTFDRPKHGPIRLRCATDDGSFVTEWISLPPAQI